MKYRTPFRLALKIVGLWMAVSAGLSVLPFLTIIISERLLGFQDIVEITRDNFASGTFVYLCGELGVGLYLFFGGEWVVNLAIPRDRRYCRECGCELNTAASTACLDCGTPFET